MRVAVPSRLEDEMAMMARAIDRQFEGLLTVPDDQRARLYEAMRHAGIGGGKRMRPLLVKASCDLFNVSEESAVRTGLAVECIHVYSLVHDDLPAMDNDDLRRGRPTAHKKFDEATAILAGDGLLTLAFDILARPETHPSPAVRAELVDHAGGQGRLGADHGQRDLLLLRPFPQGDPVRDRHVLQPRVERGAAVAGRDVHRLHLGRLRQLPGQRVLAAAAADDEDFHSAISALE